MAIFKSAKQVLIFGAYGYYNVGTEAILSGIITRIKRYNKNINIVVISNSPKHTKEIHKIKSKGRIISILTEFIRSDMILIGGDELINDYYYNHIKYNNPYRKITSLFEGKFVFLLSLLSKIFNKKVIIYAIGVGDIGKKSTMILVTSLLKNAKKILLRDELSLKKIEKTGIKKKLQLIKDPSVDMKEINSKQLEDILKSEKLVEKKYIIFTVKNQPKHNKHHFSLLINTIEWLVEHYKYDVVIMSCSNHPHNIYEQDKKIIAKIYRSINHKKHLKLLTKYDNPLIIDGLISKSKLLVGMRMHSIIFACKHHVPNICIPYSTKHKAVLKQLGFGTTFYDLNCIDKEGLKPILERFLK